jgi:EAL domain-containing protein (putative c-di-GMP-specific phosphodiesterase class I)
MRDTTLLSRILRPAELQAVFQPVIDVSGPVRQSHYYEGLIRGPRGTSVESPEILFEYARRKRSLPAVDRACIDAIFAAAAALPGEPRLGINVHAPTLALDTGFVSFLTQAGERWGIALERLVVEIVEHAAPWDVAALRGAIADLRSLGTRIALDDIGLGQSNYLMMLECRPDYFKIDRHFVTDCHRDFHKRAVLRSIAVLALQFGSQVIAEGLECPADLETVNGTGINLVQGWLFGAPRPAPPCVLSAEPALVAGLGAGCGAASTLAPSTGVC